MNLTVLGSFQCSFTICVSPWSGCQLTTQTLHINRPAIHSPVRMRVEMTGICLFTAGTRNRPTTDLKKGIINSTATAAVASRSPTFRPASFSGDLCCSIGRAGLFPPSTTLRSAAPVHLRAHTHKARLNKAAPQLSTAIATPPKRVPGYIKCVLA